MAPLRTLFLFLFLVSSVAQDGCQCDDAVASATANVTKEKDNLALQLSSTESSVTSALEELMSCETKVAENEKQFAASEAALKSKMEALTARKALLEDKAAGMEMLERAVEEARAEMNAAAEKAKKVEEDLKEKAKNELDLLRKAEQDIVEAHRELQEARKQLELVKQFKAAKYFNFGSMWDSFVTSLNGDKEALAETVEAFDEAAKSNEL
jgi:chromosome segregation ATPase